MDGSGSWQGEGHKQAWVVRPWEKQTDNFVRGPTIFCKSQKEQFNAIAPGKKNLKCSPVCFTIINFRGT